MMEFVFEDTLIFLYVILAVLCIIERVVKRKTALIMLFFFCIILIFFTAFRPVTDTLDTGIYIETFNNFPNTIFLLTSGGDELEQIPMEYGYLIMNGLVKILVDDAQVLFLIISSISIVAYYATFSEISAYPIFSFFVYFSLLYVFRELAQIRNGVSCSLVLYAVYLLNKDKIKDYIVTVIIACLFHTTAVIAFLFYFVKKIKWNKTRCLIVVLLAVLFVNIEWVYGVLDILGNMGMLFYKIAKYQGDVVAQQEVYIWKYIGYCALFLLVSFNRWNDEKVNLYIGIFALGILMQGSFHEFKEIADRVSSQCYTVLFLLIPLYVKNAKRGTVYFGLFMVVLSVYFMRTVHWLHNPLQ